nr:ribonuclease H-like domain-containing protein [Tanacetum cinerariifolium]
MTVYNFVHNSENGDDYIEDPDPVTLISELDISDPLYLYSHDTTALTIVSIKLKGTENYQVWSCAMLLVLEGKNKSGFNDGTCKGSNTDEVFGKQWDMVNTIVLGWILNSISEELFLVIPKDCVTLISAHKLAKENKVIVAFDEDRCYFLNQDLNLKNVLELHDWHCKLAHPTEPVLNVLKDSLQNDKKDNIGKSDSSSSSVSGSNINTADFPVDYRNDADSSDELVAIQNKGVSTLEENVFSEDIDALLRTSTWEITELPGCRKAIGSKWIYKIKFRSSGEIDRCLLNIVVSMSWPVFQLDVNNAFLYVDLEEVVYMKPPKGYFSYDNKSKSDYSLYTKSDKGIFLALLVYVDDIIITRNSVSKIEKFKVYLKSKFMIKDLGKLKYFLGIEVVDTDKGICLNQRKYVLDLLSEYDMLACKPAKTPLMSKLVIFNKTSDKDPLLKNITDYQKLMGTLIYLTNTRLNISYVVHCLSQFMNSPLTSHLNIAFKILRYLKSCLGLGIHITKTSGVVKTVKVDSANKIVDILTKWLDTVQHEHLKMVKRLGMLDVYQVRSPFYTYKPLSHSVQHDQKRRSAIIFAIVDSEPPSSENQ